MGPIVFFLFFYLINSYSCELCIASESICMSPEAGGADQNHSLYIDLKGPYISMS